MHFLVVDEDTRVRRRINRAMRQDETTTVWTFELTPSPSGALAIAHARVVDAIASAWRFTNDHTTASDFARRLRREGTITPLLVYSADKWGSRERVDALRAGADQVTSIRHSMSEFFASMQALMRRAPLLRKSTTSRIGELVVMQANASLAGEELDLTEDQRTLLRLLIARSPDVATYDELFRELGYTAIANAHAVTEAMRRIRLKLRGAGVTIEAVRGVGYRIVETKNAARHKTMSRRAETAMTNQAP